MDANAINTAVVAAIKDSAVPRIDKEKVFAVFGTTQGEVLTAKVSELVREAVSMPIEWGNMSLEEGVNDILRRFREKHPELSDEALHEIGRCVGWNLR
ncbi:hypothetical protein [Mycobacterium xenopi]|uniref:Uncharacterized protein n=1 Tax=Mycobacterium xenopi TaxID=1789 RepID=A0AAD1H5F8_MYCXE|nr:hypothetical protein [Mycobacterium xenopi]MDA3638549.1 hypothetical protein [Mycobacterium xenopi]MDA3656748.1 hypothetical protein [Mycobacterium xenopi]MDA3661544.1 hypothetical protein [Mycobacterium xenopi]SPX90718.1 Uncharacterised protein [Mycobacterium xenopi]BBU23894.1 hypothetical protein MYXE_36840 [Mycobacterium xenopi]